MALVPGRNAEGKVGWIDDSTTTTPTQSSTAYNYSPTVAGQLTGYSTGEGSDAYGYKSLVPDPSAALTASNRANIYNLSDLTGLASQVNTFNQNQLLNQITSLYPQFTSTVNQLGSNISDWAQGNLSQSTLNSLNQMAQQRGVAGGMDSSSPSTNAALMNLLGTTTEGLQNKALSGYSTLMGAIPTTKNYDFTSQFVSPSTEYNAQLLSNVYQASPNPATAAETSLQNAQNALSQGYFNTGAGSSSGTGMSSWDTWLNNLINPKTSATSGTTAAAGSSSDATSGFSGGGSSSGAISGYTDALDEMYKNYLGQDF